MKIWLSILLGVIGYIIALTLYGVGFIRVSEPIAHIFYVACILCPTVDNFTSPVPWRGPILIYAPINALLYAAAGWIIGLAVVKFRVLSTYSH